MNAYRDNVLAATAKADAAKRDAEEIEARWHAHIWNQQSGNLTLREEHREDYEDFCDEPTAKYYVPFSIKHPRLNRVLFGDGDTETMCRRIAVTGALYLAGGLLLAGLLIGG
jgi:hypothetical protein